MNCNPNPYLKKPRPYNYVQNQSAIRSYKKLSVDRAHSHSNVIRPDFKAMIEVMPSDQQLIEQYIEELKDKLQQIRNSPKKKISSRLETQQIFKRKYSEASNSKSKAKSNNGNLRTKSVAQSAAFQTAKKTNRINGLNDFNLARDEFKKSKQMLFQPRVGTEKQNHRYADCSNKTKTEAKLAPNVTQSCDLRLRSNTEEVIRSQKNPARIYRYSSLKKTQCVGDEANYNNNFLFDKIISVQQNINIYPPDHKSKERLRREQGEYVPVRKETQRSEIPSPKKSSPKRKIEGNEPTEKIQDLSTINAKKETLNFLGESCLELKDQLQQKKQKEVSKILDFLGWKTNEMKQVLTNLKQKKRKTGLDKLGKIFPKGFFI